MLQDVYNVDFNASLYGLLVTSGLGHIRFWRMAETFTGLKLKGQTGRFGARNVTNIEAVIQFPDGQVLSGSEGGTLLLWEEALLKAEFKKNSTSNCHEGKINQMFMHEGEVLTLGEDGFIRSWHVDHIKFVQPSYCGQIFFLGPMHEISVCSQARLMHMVQENPADPENTLWYVQDKQGRLWRVDLSILHTSLPPKVILAYHGGPVIACAASPNAHVVATAGHDGMFRIFDCLRKEEILSMIFSSPVSCLIWVPLSVDTKGASVIIGFDDGILRKVAFCAKTSSTQEQKSAVQHLEGTLSQAFKPHRNKITSLAFSFNGKTLASGSSDKTIFLFAMEGTEFTPMGWLNVPTGVRQLVWTPAYFSYLALLVACEEGIALQVHLLSSKVTDNFHISDVQMNCFKFHSVKSEILHAEKLAKLKEEKLKSKAKPSSSHSDTSQAAEEEEKTKGDKKETEEKDGWEPYVPDTPSPILQAMYSKTENHFWLSMGDYDIDYLYMCRFPEQNFSEEGGKPEGYLTKPVRAVAVPDCSKSAVTVLKVDEKQEMALLGFSNGHIRLVQLPETEDPTNLDDYWDISAHDGKHGGLTCMDFAFDHCFIVTSGMDGNILLFSYRGLLEGLTGATCALPTDIHHHAKCTEDLQPDALWFPDQIDKHVKESKAREAEESKEKTRVVLKELQRRLKSLLFDNERLPAWYRLSRQELLVNTNIEVEFKLKIQDHLAEIRRMYAWQSDKTRLMLEKAKLGWLRHEELPHQFSVMAFNSPCRVKSFRVPAPSPGLTKLQRTSTASKGVPSPREEDIEGCGEGQETTTSMDDDLWHNAYEFTRQRSVMITGSAARTLKLALDRAAKGARKREQRRAAWDSLFKEKVLIDKDRPEDLQAIEDAKNTIGDLKLKTGPEKTLEMAKVHTSGAICRDLAKIDGNIRKRITQFNEKLMKMRDEKRLILCVVHSLNTRLIQKSYGTRTLPDLPLFSPEEIPEVGFAFDEKSLFQFKNDFGIKFEDTDGLQGESFKKRRKSRETRPICQHHHTYYKAERTELPDIVNFFSDQHTQTENETDIPDLVLVGLELESDLTSSFRQEINAISNLQLTFEEDMTLSIVNDMKAEFDEKLQCLQKEHADLEVFIKRADLAYLAMLQDFLLDLCTREEQKALNEQQTAKKEQLMKNSAICTQLKKQIIKKTEESEEITRKLSELWLRFQNVTADKKGSHEMRFLTLLYKRKVHKVKVRDEEKSDSDESSTESSVSVSESESGTASSMSMDLDVCPETLDETMYHQVVELQQQHQELERVHNRINNDLVSLNKEMEQKMKENETLQRAVQKVEDSLYAFWKEKIKTLNEIEEVVLIHQDRIEARVPNGLVVDRDQLKQLRARVNELKQDIQTQEQSMRDYRKEHVALRRGTRLLSEKVEVLTAKSKEEMLKKFGKIVDLKKLELVVTNPKRELLTCRMMVDKQLQLEELKQADAQINDLKAALTHTTEQSTLRLLQQAELLEKKQRLEKQLNRNMAKVHVRSLIKQKRERPEDREKLGLTLLVQKQASVIEDCRREIQTLQPHASVRTVRPRLPPINGGHTTRSKLARDVPERRLEKLRLPKL